jgi:nucleoside-diphosphate-sugar epimerase
MIESPSLTPSSVLIVGCGYVGLRVARLWNSMGMRVFAITRSEAKAQQLQGEGIQPLIFDLGSNSKWPQLPDVSVILWSVGFDRRPGTSRNDTWIGGLQRLLAALPRRSRPLRFVYTSSTGVYGDGDGREVDELTPRNPCSEGGVACAAAEESLQDFGRNTGSQIAILRLAGIYGPDRLLRRLSELRERVPLTSKPDEWLNLIHVDDAVRAIDFAGRTSVWPGEEPLQAGAGGVLNIVAANSVTRRTYYSTLASLVSAPEPVFQTAANDDGATASSRGRGGNRQVVSRFRKSLPIQYQFDDCAVGLAHAVAESKGLEADGVN